MVVPNKDRARVCGVGCVWLGRWATLTRLSTATLPAYSLFDLPLDTRDGGLCAVHTTDWPEHADTQRDAIDKPNNRHQGSSSTDDLGLTR